MNKKHFYLNYPFKAHKKMSDLTTFGGSCTVNWLKIIYLAHECVPLLHPLSPQRSPLSVGDEKHYIFH